MSRRAATLAELRGAIWADRALRLIRKRLAGGELTSPASAPPPGLPASALRGVEALLRRRRHTCLEGALVRQRWLATHGDPRDVVIGVESSSGFAAHAWLDGDGYPPAAGFLELKRIAP